MDIQIKIQCPCCNNPVDPREHRGIVINRNAWLGSQLVTLREQATRLANRKPNPPLLTKLDLEEQKRNTQVQIESCEKEQKILRLILNPKEEKKMTDSTIIPGPPDTIPDPTPVSNVISFEDFEKVELRAGTVRFAEVVPKSELLKLDVSFGEQLGNRTILARIATSFTPEAIVGRQIIAVLNLAPRKMKGVESHGMLLAAKRSDGVIALASFSAVVPDGEQVG